MRFILAAILYFVQNCAEAKNMQSDKHVGETLCAIKVYRATSASYTDTSSVSEIFYRFVGVDIIFHLLPAMLTSSLRFKQLPYVDLFFKIFIAKAAQIILTIYPMRLFY